MPKWTKEQEHAISESGKNILVSAGAGSGKTAVLTERVIRKLKNGISINNLLILTFTNNAAHEMKERIRKAIKKVSIEDEKLKEQLDYIDIAYITTFDSFALSIVKKYHYILNIGKDISIIDSSIVDLKREEILDDIFENYYKNKNEDFLKLVDLLCVKDDKMLKNSILNINKKIDLLEDKYDYLDKYIKEHYCEEFINNIMADYERVLINRIKLLKELFNDLSYEVDSNYIEKNLSILEPLFNSEIYDDIKNNSDIKLGILKGATDLGKIIKKDITNLISDINNMCYYDKDELINNINSTKPYLVAIIDIIRELNKRIDVFKHNINKYEFNDISCMAINIVKNNINIRNELTDNFKEICVDEYQDTNDLQEGFIKLISNKNVYCVGDIKQSIYRFRNANPILFKNKYDLYSNNVEGIKIDLVKNFRSRSEVLNDINTIFNHIMDNYIGGAMYSDSHNMIFGNETYNNEGKTEQNNYLELYNYQNIDGYSNTEIEAFIIAKDINKKINEHYKVFDKDKLILRDCTYDDFVILMDRGSSFDIYKKIFEYCGIPSTLYKDENIINLDELYIIKNIIGLIIKIKKNEYDIDFKYLFTSIARSYVNKIEDNDLFELFLNNSFKNTDLYNKCYSISNTIDCMSNVELLDSIINEFDIYNKFINVGNINSKITIIDYLYSSFNDLDSIGYGVYELSNYLDSIIKSGKEIRIPMINSNNNSVKIMTIHKSKGLEYHICYFSGFDKKFNLSDIKDNIIFDNKYGIITPIDNEGLDDIVSKYIVKDNYIRDDISERIRLLYVALTRAKEKMIIVGSFNKDMETKYDINGVVDNYNRLKYRSFNDIINSVIKYLDSNIVDIELDKIGLSKDYSIIKQYNYKDNIDYNDTIINVKHNIYNKDTILEKHYSKENNNIIDSDTMKNIKLGLYLHELFESVDFINPNFDNLNESDINYIKNFLKLELFYNIKLATVYKEYEFIYNKDDIKYHGIIDLMLEYSDHIDIVDYKLMNTKSDDYIKQLNGYKDYIEHSFNKKVNIYLYSFINNKVDKL